MPTEYRHALTQAHQDHQVLQVTRDLVKSSVAQLFDALQSGLTPAPMRDLMQNPNGSTQSVLWCVDNSITVSVRTTDEFPTCPPPELSSDSVYKMLKETESLDQFGADTVLDGMIDRLRQTMDQSSIWICTGLVVTRTASYQATTDITGRPSLIFQLEGYLQLVDCCTPFDLLLHSTRPFL